MQREISLPVIAAITNQVSYLITESWARAPSKKRAPISAQLKSANNSVSPFARWRFAKDLATYPREGPRSDLALTHPF